MNIIMESEVSLTAALRSDSFEEVLIGEGVIVGEGIIIGEIMIIYLLYTS